MHFELTTFTKSKRWNGQAKLCCNVCKVIIKYHLLSLRNAWLKIVRCRGWTDCWHVLHYRTNKRTLKACDGCRTALNKWLNYRDVPGPIPWSESGSDRVISKGLKSAVKDPHHRCVKNTHLWKAESGRTETTSWLVLAASLRRSGAFWMSPMKIWLSGRPIQATAWRWATVAPLHFLLG